MSVEDPTSLLEDLMSEDPPSRLLAAGKLVELASSLSVERIEKELFPHLRYILEVADNEDEFLVALAESAGKVVEINSKSAGVRKAASEFFETLLNSSDPRTREAALRGLCKAVEGDGGLAGSVGERLARGPPTAKAASASFIASIVATDNTEVVSILPRLLDDGCLGVRRAALRAIGVWLRSGRVEGLRGPTLSKMAKLIDPATPEPLLLELLSPNLLQPLMKELPPSVSTTITNTVFSLIDSSATSWRIKLISLENFSLFAQRYSADSSSFRDYVIRIFEANDPQIKGAIIRMIEALMSSKTNCESLLSLIDSFYKEKSPYVVSALYGLIAKALFLSDPPQKSLLFAVESSLTGAPKADRKATGVLLEAAILRGLNGETLAKYMASQASDPAWKTRRLALVALGKAALCLAEDTSRGADSIRSQLIAMARCFGKDVVLSNRKLVVETLGRLGAEGAREASGLLTVWSGTNSYLYRISALQGLASFVDFAPTEEANRLSRAVFEILGNERVVNVKIAMAKCAAAIRTKLDAKTLAFVAELLKAVAKADADPDVLYYTDIALNNYQ